jgi:hypothetical protein
VEDLEFIRSTLKISSLPSIVYYHLGLEKKKAPNLVFDKKEKLERIEEEISYNVWDTTKTVTEYNINDHMNKAFERQKSLVILTYSNEYDYVSFIFKAIAQFSRYEDYILFAKIKDPSIKFKEAFAIEFIPDIMTVLYQSEDKSIKTAHMRRDIDAIQLRHYLFEMTSKVINSRPTVERRIFEIANLNVFEEKCQSKDLCFIAFLDGSKVFLTRIKCFFFNLKTLPLIAL